ncbi:1-acyl-sn-glycerol-3-phosphate acyltransferase 1, chloroplastic [Gracilariopsis chorda]|uniref:1-acyl-sn-glycerol-3-phosphate acyltransferase 1, chloroplastic n=1 Tax=Gracilariopsis chorda TaxID=448386 RepID=A0A2V3IYU9_9FLOR|nr:1-acyl-sn-glycerol-3-phosphate acyltransferase 1, chloroplastic [Gracilariopsis chorda]|eukprot:PXF47336.1 1-acyl-sn-glycerol-3-phosphate acyltransferase 1, chloroplastic [Gracilariopsis chorda]
MSLLSVPPLRAFVPTHPPALRPLPHLSTRNHVRPSRTASILRRRRVLATSADTPSPSSPNFRNSEPAADNSNNNNSKKKLSIVGLIFLAITYLWSVILFIPMALAHPVVLWRDNATRRFHDLIAMTWMRWSLQTAAVSTNVINAHLLPPADTPAVFVANHTSYLDIYVFAYLRRRIKYVSKAEIFRIPIVGWAMAMAGNISFKRLDRSGQMEAYRRMLNVLENGLSLVIFPEGTRSSTGKLHRFKAGAFRAAKALNAPVVPVTILGTRESMPSHAWVPLKYPSQPLSVVVHPALDSSKLTVQQMQDQAFRSIDSALPPHLRQKKPAQQQPH